MKDLGLGILIATHATPLPTDIVNQGFLGGINIVNNTFINPGDFAVRVAHNTASPNALANNLVVISEDKGDFAFSNSWDLRQANRSYTAIGAAGFINATAGDYRLNSTSTSVDAGIDSAAYKVLDDSNGITRPQGAGYDVGAFERP